MKSQVLRNISFCVLALVLCLAPIFFAGCCGDENLTDAQKTERIIENTSSKILEVNEKFMETYEQSSSESVSANSTQSLTDRTLNESAYKPVQQLTISFGYYALSEYFAEYMQSDFLDKTLYVEQTIYPNQDIFVKFELNENSFEIYIYTVWEGAFNEYINISIFYDAETYAPTKFIHRENRHWTYSGSQRNFYGYIEVDFAEYDCLIETSIFQTEDTNLNNATDEFLSENLERYIREEFSFENYKDRITSTSANLSTDELYSYVRNFNYVYEEAYKNNFSFSTAENYPDGDEAMGYSFDRYLIIENDDGTLTKVNADI